MWKYNSDSKDLLVSNGILTVKYPSVYYLDVQKVMKTGAPNEHIVQNHLNLAF